ncbi:Aste57867_15099 [Aphanomyces stellatus]|uniref:Aste57867_15099 protein n=1 Tax=Aphanomyces stellatus TaxID=120398 RepID=A0A485L376_9STRA|nr:hypothetical protein As57867_015043 [Aphanomyces stellatus]VFT91912.1 Aste57867_15099 [Aphanomyces stellatus]
MDDLHMEANAVEYPLHEAAREGNIASLKHILSLPRTNVNDIDQYGLTALHWACDHASDNTAALELLAAGADVNDIEQRLFKRRPIHFAALRGSVSMLKLLIEHGADVNACDGQGKTALHCAAHGGYQDVVTHLLDEQCDACVVTKEGQTALHLAMLNGQSSVGDYLRQRCPELEAMSRQVC